MSLSGGHLSEISEPHVRRFGDVPIGSKLPDGTLAKKRQIEIFIMVFSGIGQHFHVSVREEDNPIWNSAPPDWVFSKAGTWQHAWDDDGGKGKMFSERFARRRDVVAWVKRTVKKHFSMKTHRLVWTSPKVRQWFYKDGD